MFVKIHFDQLHYGDEIRVVQNETSKFMFK